MSKSALSRMLLSLFYQLRKDYGLKIQYTKPGKGDIDSDTGLRDAANDKTFPLDAVETPVDAQGEFILKLLGKVEKPKTIFMIRVRDLPKGVEVETDDYFTANGLKYKVTGFSTNGGTLIELSGTAFT